MRSILMASGGAAVAGALWVKLPNWAKVVSVAGLVTLGTLELNKDANESWFSSAIFGGQAAEGEAKTVDPLKTEADAAAGKPVSGSARMMAKQVEGLGAEAIQKQAVADAAAESIEEIAQKKALGRKLTATESLRLEEYKKLRSEAETAEAQSTAARAQAKAEKQSAEIASRIISSMNNGTIIDTMMDLAGVRNILQRPNH